MKKVPVKDLPIYVYTCVTHPDRMAIARIGDLPLEIKGKTPLAAKKAAEEWIEMEAERLSK